MITLPKLFEKKLATNPSLLGAVKKNLEGFSPWLSHSGMPFFPAFTDHSPRHISDVLETAASLISDQTHDVLTAEDIAVLCLAVLLHDCGMHLTQDGLRALVKDEGPSLIDGLGDKPWAQLWRDFLSEASRFSDEKLEAIFGDKNPAKIESLNLENLSERDHLLAGEFIRRHHARLAHEIAINGVPSLSTAKLKIEGIDREIADISGLVARSHGLPIRKVFSYLEEKYAVIAEFRGIKPPYLMALLRIADYIQVKSERAIATLLLVKELRSPISRLEWKAHFAVRDVSTNHDDPEAIFVNTAPKDIRTFLKLDALFKDIQREIDDCWAVIGEVYGKIRNLSKIGLTVRRLRSNLDNLDRFARTVNYIPVHARFKSSGPDLLKLLVGPLYSYNYGIGVRELIQNAVDACKELEDIFSSRDSHHFREQSTDVRIEIIRTGENIGELVITDKGVGMTLETILHYFLVAGGSFRCSDLWRQRHIGDDGVIEILRGGRFGVGALAAFLLGDEIEVETRHYSSDPAKGIFFKARIDDTALELHNKNLPVGTKISVKISDKRVLDTLDPKPFDYAKDEISGEITLDSWDEVDWYAQESPSVEIIWTGESKIFIADKGYTKTHIQARFYPTHQLAPSLNEISIGWRRLPEHPPYKAILFRIPKKIRMLREYYYVDRETPEVSVNGIRVQKFHDYPTTYIKVTEDAMGDGLYFRIPRPNLAIFDPVGICPINLQRDEISFEQLGIDHLLAQEILRIYIEQLRHLFSPPSSINQINSCLKSLSNAAGIRFCQRSYDGTSAIYPYLITRDGISLADPYIVNEIGISKIYFFEESGINATSNTPLSWLEPNEAIIITRFGEGTQAESSWFRTNIVRSTESKFEQYQKTPGLPWLAQSGHLLLCSLKDWEKAEAPGRISKALLKQLIKIHKTSEIAISSCGTIADEKHLADRLIDLSKTLGIKTKIAAWQVLPRDLGQNKSILIEKWIELNGGYYLSPLQSKELEAYFFPVKPEAATDSDPPQDTTDTQ